ncbi:MAG: hypothetical protein EA409_12460 [Saprospirales bacterium]|nr:MAG: hypothetical protein EA409_12460 [Saprospirales bacterium]
MKNTNREMTLQEELLLQNGNKKLVLYRDLRDSTVQLFDEVLWGTGDNQYQHKDSRRRLEILDNPNFVELRYEDKLAAMCLFINRRVVTGAMNHNYFAVRYLFSVPEYRDKNLTGKYALMTMKIMQERQAGPTLFVGVVEHRNKRSFKLVKSVGYEKFSIIKTVGFSRFFPKKSSNVKEVNTAVEQGKVRELLSEFYKDYSMVHFDSIFKEPYFVFEKDGEFLAGAQVQKAHWVVKNIGGKWTNLLLELIPYIPFLRNIFNPSKFRFLGLDGIFFREGCEKEALKLFSHLLKIHKHHSAMFWADERSPLYKNLVKSRGLGLLNRFTNEGDSFMMVNASHLSEAEKEILKSKPAYHSAFDFL